MLPYPFWDFQPALRALYGRCMEPVCQNFSLSRTELDILLFLANNPKYDTAAEISDVRHLAKSHVSVSLKSLLQKELLTGSAEPGDRRRIHLKLTDMAAPIIEEGRKKQADFAGWILDGFAPEELEQLHRYMQRMGDNIRTHWEELQS